MKNVKKSQQKEQMPSVIIKGERFYEGKGLFNLAIGLLLLSLSARVITLEILSAVLGVLFCLKGLLQYLHK
ncbi:MAG: hypothetical protein N3D10_00640 [Candidatus Micrarchaeota archaeon]|nr:hypothetical protein [Candidatus Micrarchaeota archaeon]